MITKQLKAQTGALRLTGTVGADFLSVDVTQDYSEARVYLLGVPQVRDVIGLLQEMVKEAERLAKESA